MSPHTNVQCSLSTWDFSKLIPKDMLNTYCYIHSTFIIPKPDVKQEHQSYPGWNNCAYCALGAYDNASSAECSVTAAPECYCPRAATRTALTSVTS